MGFFDLFSRRARAQERKGHDTQMLVSPALSFIGACEATFHHDAARAEEYGHILGQDYLFAGGVLATAELIDSQAVHFDPEQCVEFIDELARCCSLPETVALVDTICQAAQLTHTEAVDQLRATFIAAEAE